MKRGSAVPVPKAGQSAAPETTSPVFIEDISIKPGNGGNNARSGGSQHPAILTSATAGNNKWEGSVPVSVVELSTTAQFRYAIMLDLPVEEIRDNKIYSFIEEWYGTPYKFGGLDRSGTDCSGFVLNFMFANYDIRLPRKSSDQYLQSKRIKKHALQEGDLVFFITRGKKNGISHVGVYLCNNKFVHAATNGGVMINDLDESYYSQHYAGAGRVR
jgi:lipoprotein Spr